MEEGGEVDKWKESELIHILRYSQLTRRSERWVGDLLAAELPTCFRHIDFCESYFQALRFILSDYHVQWFTDIVCEAQSVMLGLIADCFYLDTFRCFCCIYWDMQLDLALLSCLPVFRAAAFTATWMLFHPLRFQYTLKEQSSKTCLIRKLVIIWKAFWFWEYRVKTNVKLCRTIWLNGWSHGAGISSKAF
jgi:hypothetical protein